MIHSHVITNLLPRRHDKTVADAHELGEAYRREVVVGGTRLLWLEHRPPLPGVSANVVDEAGDDVLPGEAGYVTVGRPPRGARLPRRVSQRYQRGNPRL